MFESVTQIAEQMVTSVSRRQFLGRFGGRALAFTAAVVGLLALPRGASAAGALCGPNSIPACLGKRVGDGCRVTPHIGGHCRLASNGDCGCWVGR